jgi:hypothetical protein
MSFDGNGPVLAKNTTEITVGKEDGSGSSFSHQRYLFTKMWMCRVDHEFVRSTAKSSFAILPIDTAPPGAKFTLFENGIRLFYSLGEFAFFLKLRITRIPLFSFFIQSKDRTVTQKQRAAQYDRFFYEISTC